MENKNMLKKICIISIVLFLLSRCQSDGNKNSSNSKGNETNKVLTQNSIEFVKNSNNKIEKDSIADIPSDLLGFIKKEYPNHMLFDLSNYNKEWKEYTTGVLPYFCESDFSGDGKKDYGILLISEEKEIELFGFIVKENGFEEYKIDKFSEFHRNENIIISIYKKGVWVTYNDSIVVPNDGILVDFVEASLSRAYHWNGETFIKVLGD